MERRIAAEDAREVAERLAGLRRDLDTIQGALRRRAARQRVVELVLMRAGLLSVAELDAAERRGEM